MSGVAQFFLFALLTEVEVILLAIGRVATVAVLAICSPGSGRADAFPSACLGEKQVIVGTILSSHEKIPQLNGASVFDVLMKHSPLSVVPYMVKLPMGSTLVQFSSQGYFAALGDWRWYSSKEISDLNPDVEWLKHVSSGTVSYFNADKMFPVQPSSRALKVSVPPRATERFVIEVTVRNLLKIPLCRGSLVLQISGGPFKIVGGTSYYTSETYESYQAGETRSHEFTVELRPSPRPKIASKLNVNVSFVGYGELDSMMDSNDFLLFGLVDRSLGVTVDSGID